MPNFKRIGGGPWKNVQKSDDLTWNDPIAMYLSDGILCSDNYICLPSDYLPVLLRSVFSTSLS